MIPVQDYSTINLSQLETDSFWDIGAEDDHKMHRIHAYPAKFPAFITTKALAFAEQKSIRLTRIADIFCGCGTVALEARRNNLDFWGCDINPVATLIAHVKSRTYQSYRLRRYFDEIVIVFQNREIDSTPYDNANSRLQYWYEKDIFNELRALKDAIEEVTTSKSDYRKFFLCAFSNILKATSKWLTKSIKPQIDPDKIPPTVLKAFQRQFQFMYKANEELNIASKAKIEIVTDDFLGNAVSSPNVDMIITSPPYVTSYEYADVHQLSALWLGYTDDYRALRKGSIGSRHKDVHFEREVKGLNQTGNQVVFQLIDRDKSKAKVVAKYYLDIVDTVRKCYGILKTGGLAVFVIGDTEYRGIRIENTRHLLECLGNAGFCDLQITKRKISGKNLTPFRDEIGRFTSDKTSRQIYSEEFIIIGFKK